MTRAYNFSAGPAAIPTAVLEQAQAELLEWNDARASVLEISHRSKAVTELFSQARADLRELLAIPEHYQILFMSGGAQVQFAMLPLNLAGDKQGADYIETGIWSKKAGVEASKYLEVNTAASSASDKYTHIPARETWQLRDDAAYVHYTANETINGLAFPEVPDVGEVPLVCDMSSCLLSEPLDVSRFGVIYACAQKNIGPAGVTIMIVRDDLLGKASKLTPSVFNFAEQAKMDSCYNTPPVFACYFAALNFAWLKAEGGLGEMAKRNQHKAQKLYAAIDASDFYHNPVEPTQRSSMNVPFTLSNPDLDASFLQQSSDAGLLFLKGHRLLGGMRASLYNAVPEAAVDSLIEFMGEFEQKMG